MIALTGKCCTGEKIILQYDALSTDDLNSILPQNKEQNIGSSVFCVDTGEVYKLNLDQDGNLKWYKL